jgi:hypothetical protein
MFPYIRWVAWLTRHGSELLRIRSFPASGGMTRLDLRPVLIPITLVFMTAIFQVAAVPVPVIGHGWVRLERTHFPVELLPELKQYEHEHPKGTPIFNDMLFGGFLIYYTPGLRVFIDDRCELYGDKGLLAYEHTIKQDPSQIDRWAQKYGFDIALVQNDFAFDRYLESSNAWIRTHRTASASLYRKKPI